MFGFKPKKRIYLDYAAATPVAPEVLAAVQPFFRESFANPSAIHAEGQAARRAVDAARLKVARQLQVRESEVVFTASGTESNNLAISGVIAAHHQAGIAYEDMTILTTAIEHPSITNTVAYWQTQGVQVEEVSVGEDGVIDVKDLESRLSPRVVLITCAYVNSELGTIMPLRKLARVVKAFNEKTGTDILIHADAAQAPLWLPCTLGSIGADIISLDAGKCYGPKGVGVLAYRHGVKLAPWLFGGGQEAGIRPGTENVPLIVGAAAALVRAQTNFQERAETVKKVRDYAVEKLTTIEGVTLNGSGSERVANNVNVSIDGVEAEFAAVTLDVAGIACSTKSACGSGKGTGSQVVRAITGDDERALTSLRFTLGEDTTTEEIDVLVETLRTHIEKTRAFAHS